MNLEHLKQLALSRAWELAHLPLKGSENKKAQARALRLVRKFLSDDFSWKPQLERKYFYEFGRWPEQATGGTDAKLSK